ncbi:diguanylate cyclase/phosphodiesterase (GGDEF & EAL domains) with PAS/PAC sensor(s) [hydrothermal vent metagenome]|uniref:Diguanylate cyclase/phosphodiesterase (GGDEF & EAL domains) with PAS/PAC sensor(S) n=1 Tax=hydrothermal vent metagenome TaxID=652676 RepID=A0A1W1CFU1_9ZZZZ
MRNIKIFILFSVLLFIFIAFKTYGQYQSLERTEKVILLNESQSLSKFISAFRQTYQKSFIQNHIQIDEKTINLLPVKTISEMSQKFTDNVQEKIIIRTVSDRPRNSDNMANRFELKMIQYFNNNPTLKDKFLKNNDIYSYVKPLRIQKSCLKCHGKREDAIPSVRDKYAKAYNYRLGEIRGLLNITIVRPKHFSTLYLDFKRNLAETILLYIFFLAVTYFLLLKIFKKEEKYTKQLEIDIARHTQEIEKQKEELYRQAYHDSLTGLPNRTLFHDRLEHGLELAKRNHYTLALLFIDIDNFKYINDTFGHAVGDAVLIKVSERFSQVLRKEDTLSRIGGDEFTIILENINGTENIRILVNKILKSLHQPITLNHHDFHITCSIGIARYPEECMDFDTLVRYADMAMYKAKKQGKNNIQFYSEDVAD